MSDPRIESYAWAGGREPVLRFGPEDGPVVVLALPLFEEANRTRAFGVTLLRALATRGIGGVLPELPGQGESEIATNAMRLADLRAALARAPGSHVVAIRSGALVVDTRPCWLLAPQNGADLVRELRRVGGATPNGEEVAVAGNLLAHAFFDELGSSRLPGEGRGQGAEVAGAEDDFSTMSGSHLDPGLRRGSADRVVRLLADPRPADRHVEGEPLWRRAEPASDPVLVEILAVDIADWVASCES